MFLPVSISILQVLCVLFPVWVEGFYPLVVPPLGMEGTSLPGLLLRPVFFSWQFGSWGGCSRGWQGLGAASPAQLPTWTVSASPGECAGGEAWVKPIGPWKGEAQLGWWLSCHLCFPSGPHPEVMEVGCNPPGTSFFSMLQALPTSEEILAAAAAPPAPCCCSLW